MNLKKYILLFQVLFKFFYISLVILLVPFWSTFLFHLILCKVIHIDLINQEWKVSICISLYENILFIHNSIYGHFCCFQFFTSRNNLAMSNLVISHRISLVYVPSSEFGGLFGRHILNFTRRHKYSLRLVVPVYTPSHTFSERLD